jgi:hypothetical protein
LKGPFSKQDLTLIEDAPDLGGASSAPKVYSHKDYPEIKWVVKESDYQSTDPGDVATVAEHQAYRLIQIIAQDLPVPLVPVVLVNDAKGKLWGNMQPMIENTQELSTTYEAKLDPRTPEGVAYLTHIFRQHWVDLYIDDLDDNFGNWLIDTSRKLPVRIDHGYAFVDDLSDGRFLFKKHFPAGVSKSVMKEHKANEALQKIATDTLKEVASALQNTITQTVLQGTFAPFKSIAKEMNGDKLASVVSLYELRAQNFMDYAKKGASGSLLSF